MERIKDRSSTDFSNRKMSILLPVKGVLLVLSVYLEGRMYRMIKRHSKDPALTTRSRVRDRFQCHHAILSHGAQENRVCDLPQ